ICFMSDMASPRQLRASCQSKLLVPVDGNLLFLHRKADIGEYRMISNEYDSGCHELITSALMLLSLNCQIIYLKLLANFLL
ncbi:hypothetical protein L9F63_009874, partial [Diploptera punctata]